MAIISLRAYNREIEGMIDNGQLDEAVAHCRHILATFPKHIASYRLLGKAHLEQQRISDATDIFQRVLSAIPDDFISNVGMSIIREDENNLDAAIWHMELGYEAQPANIAIQDELRRLYGRRDGMQPPKVRLTRGALARMYAKGGLFDQAIAELRAAISEDPNRPDLQLLLAQMYYQSSQRVEAVDVCVNILKKIPICLEANRILAISLPEAKGSHAIKNYRQIVVSMDPYYAFAEPEAISSDQVPENAVNIERLEWKSGIQIGETPNQPSWATSLGISMEKQAEENLPDWLKSAEAPAPGSTNEKAAPSISPFIWDTQEVEKIITDTSKPEGEIPDWMKDAGWNPASSEATQAPEETKPEEPIADSQASENLENANIPEWLRGIAPEGALGQGKQESQPQEDDISNPWLDQHQPGPTDSIIQWLDEKKPVGSINPPVQEETLAAVPDDEMPDWLKDLDLPQTAPAAEVLPVESTPAFTSTSSAFIEEPVIPESTEAEIEAAPIEETVEPAVEAQPALGETILTPEIPESKGLPVSSDENVPDWLKEIAGVVTAAEALVIAKEVSNKETAQDRETEQITEQPLISEAAPTEELPVTAEEILTQELPVAAEEIPAQEHTVTTEEIPAPELPVTAQEIPAQELPVTSQEIPTQAVLESAEVALIAKVVPATELQVPAEELAASEIPVSAEQPETKQIPPDEAELTPATPGLVAEAAAFAWLEGLAAEQGNKEEELVAPPAEGEIPPPEWVKLEIEPTTEDVIELQPRAGEAAPAVPAEEIPEWLKGLGEESEIEQAPEVPASTVTPETEVPIDEELPAWLLELEQPEPEKETPVVSAEALEWESDELPAWLKEITESVPSEEVPAEMEAPAALVIPAVSIEASSESAEEIIPPTDVGEEVLEEPQPEIGAWVPQVEEAVQPISAIPVEAETEPAPVAEELTTKAAEFTPTTPQEQAEIPVEMVLEADNAALADARDAINQGQPSQAAGLYTRLIKQNYHLDEIIKDLQDALYRFPVDIDMWVTLGDAYHRTNDLQEALNAYTKAEELVR